MPKQLEQYVSTMAKRFSPNKIVKTWNADLGRDAVGVTQAIEDRQDSNPRVLVKWMHDCSEEWIRSEYLYSAND